MTVEWSGAGDWDRKRFAEMAKRSKRLTKAKPRIRNVFQRHWDRHFGSMPIRKSTGKLLRSMERVQIIRVRAKSIEVGSRVHHAPFYAKWRRAAGLGELAYFDERIAADLSYVLVSYIWEGTT